MIGATWMACVASAAIAIPFGVTEIPGEAHDRWSALSGCTLQVPGM
jgi:hypothetical protein